MEVLRDIILEQVKALVKKQFMLLILFILKVITPFVVIVSSAMVVVLGVCVLLGAVQIEANKKIQIETTQNTNLNSELKDQTKLIKVNGINYPLPRLKGLSEKEFYALMVLRVSEFGNSQDFDLKGMEDSCSLYQQRLVELIPNGSLSIQAKDILGEKKYNTIFTDEMNLWLKNNAWIARKKQIPQTSGYGFRGSFNTSLGITPDFHDALDFAYNMRTPVVATQKGIVYETNEKGGKYVVLQHEQSNYYTIYLHLDSIRVKKGDKVVQGQQVGESGNTGFSTGPHLHYSIYREWGFFKSFNRLYSLDPSKEYTENLIFLKQPFYGACRVLQLEQVENAFFDRLQLKRFESRQPKFKKFILNTSNYNEFTQMLVDSHAPREDTKERWKNDAKNWLIPARINNAYQAYLDA